MTGCKMFAHKGDMQARYKVSLVPNYIEAA